MSIEQCYAVKFGVCLNETRMGTNCVIVRGIQGGHFTRVHTLTMVRSIWKWLRVGRISTMWWEAEKSSHWVKYQLSFGCDCRGPPFIDSNSVGAPQNVAAADFNLRIGHEMTVCNTGLFWLFRRGCRNCVCANDCILARVSHMKFVLCWAYTWMRTECKCGMWKRCECLMWFICTLFGVRRCSK